MGKGPIQPKDARGGGGIGRTVGIGPLAARNVVLKNFQKRIRPLKYQSRQRTSLNFRPVESLLVAQPLPGTMGFSGSIPGI